MVVGKEFKMLTMGISPTKLNKAMLAAYRRTYLPELKRRTPFKTGETAGNWTIVNPAPLEFRFRNRKREIIAQVLENGRKPGIIRARPGHFLAFPKPKKRKSPYKHIPGNIAFEKDGEIFTKAVRHPGFEARRTVRKLLADPKLERLFQKALNQELGFR